ncbi:MAG: hypothetical protein IT440_02190 [Phycisphaeraceae bacterium]|nr:hypothetical protein [Phycisphaeraceae bacterium]
MFGWWDVLLVAVVSAMGTCVAYLPTPRHKALILSLPIPFTVATLSVGQGINATHVLGLPTLLGFWLVVYDLRIRRNWPIVPAIAAAAAGYCVVGSLLAKIVPRTESVFWCCLIATSVLAAVLHGTMPYRPEQSQRSLLPVWIKMPALVAVVLGLVAMKSQLAGFMTVFPMVGVLTAYEARRCLWTMCRQIPTLMLTLAGMMATIHLVTPRGGIGWGMAAGWAVMSAMLAVMTHRRYSAEREMDMSGQTVTAGTKQA